MDDPIPKIEDTVETDIVIVIPEVSEGTVSSETSRDECSFCFDETTRKTGPLIAACLCSRGGLLVHQNCVKLSIEATEDKLKVCRACNYEYKFRERRTLRTFMKKVAFHFLRVLPTIVYVMVCMALNSLIWLLLGGDAYTLLKMLAVFLALLALVTIYRVSGLGAMIDPASSPSPRQPQPPQPHNDDYTILPM